MDNQTKQIFKNELLKGWLILGVGILFAVIGLLLGTTSVSTHTGGRMMVVPGILITAWGLGIVLKYSLAGTNPEAARQLRINETDERQVLVRSRAGRDAFQFALPLICFGLFFYTILNRDTITVGIDYFWYFLIILVVLPVLVFIIRLAKYDRMY